MTKMPDKRKDGEKTSKNSKKIKVEETEAEQISYEPVHFIRSHSKNNDPADIQTQVKTSLASLTIVFSALYSAPSASPTT
jgi:hypothetical protein